MGTWMGVTTGGRFAALTNYRNPKEAADGKRSRGELVADFLRSAVEPKIYLQSAVQHSSLYPGYNLLVSDGKELYYFSNVENKVRKLEPGIYGVSNHLLDTNWPKVDLGKRGLAAMIRGEKGSMIEPLLTLMRNTEQAPDEMLPSTGVSLDWEKLLSPMFIASPTYGTRSSTVLLMKVGEIQYVERTYGRDGITDRAFKIRIK
jgi:uncharacterized protein with NRDE domain